ncbi:hypothetical protein [Psychromicrobium xiongbiense]|uniref:hypothetical protein n=1 Tax=Psychromicrobium xiongbiense TaxID=3051184 RepID=UPI002556C99A|nr:hypothetical protein [Psychromicrobium sp. YIM S02556]
MNHATHDLLRQTEGLGLGYRFFWRVQYTMLNVFGPPDDGTTGGPRGQLLRERAERVENIRARKAHHF